MGNYSGVHSSPEIRQGCTAQDRKIGLVQKQPKLDLQRFDERRRTNDESSGKISSATVIRSSSFVGVLMCQSNLNPARFCPQILSKKETKLWQT